MVAGGQTVRGVPAQLKCVGTGPGVSGWVGTRRRLGQAMGIEFHTLLPLPVESLGACPALEEKKEGAESPTVSFSSGKKRERRLAQVDARRRRKTGGGTRFLPITATNKCAVMADTGVFTRLCITAFHA